MASDQPTASIIVCTLNRRRLLDKCLRSLCSDRSAASREVIVVDNGSTDETRAVVTEAARRSDSLAVRYVVEPRRGQSHARNRGIEAARGEFILFTDDDVYVSDGWADALIAGFADPGVGAVGGRILPWWPDPPPAWIESRASSLMPLALKDLGPNPLILQPPEHPIGANMAVRSKVLQQFTPAFEPRLGHRGTARFAFDDVQLMTRIRVAHLLAYQPRALVFHRIERQRMDRVWMRRAYFQLGFARARFQRLEGSAPSLGLARRLVRAVDTYRNARRTKKANQRTTERGAAQAEKEFLDYWWAGTHIEMLTGRVPILADWLAAHLA